MAKGSIGEKKKKNKKKDGNPKTNKKASTTKGFKKNKSPNSANIFIFNTNSSTEFVFTDRKLSKKTSPVPKKIKKTSPVPKKIKKTLPLPHKPKKPPATKKLKILGSSTRKTNNPFLLPWIDYDARSLSNEDSPPPVDVLQ
jgi:hypothetical protein